MNQNRRRSDYISSEATLRLCRAADYAYYINRRLNRFITIHLEEANVDNEPHVFIKHFLKLAGDWLGLFDVPRVYLWVLENPPHGGLHLHILIHVPEDLTRAFARLQRRWLKKAGAAWGAIPTRKVLRSQVIGRPGLSDERIHYVEGLTGLMKYILKGGEKTACDELGINHHYQGSIRGKRCGFSESLGPKSRHALKGIRFHRPPHRKWAPRPLVLAGC